MTSPKKRYIVVGSGPAAFGACLALIQNGHEPHVIDIGLTTSSASHENSKQKSNAAKKARFGSTHMYEQPRGFVQQSKLSGDVPVSGGFGGLSTVWGTNIQAFHPPKELVGNHGWPTAMDYSAVLNSLSHSGRSDRLDLIYKWPVDFPDETPVSKRLRKAVALSEKLLKGQHVLGFARNATAGINNGCKLSGVCLTGCPNGAPFSTERQFSQWIEAGLITYIKGEVQFAKSTALGVEVRYQNSLGQERILAGDEAILCAGSISSAFILANSGVLSENTYTLDDTQVVYMPFLSLRRRSESSFKLAQLFFETTDIFSAKRGLHFSLYESDSSFAERAKFLFPRISRVIPKWAYDTVIAGIGFLPPALSGKIKVEKSNEGSWTVSQIEARAVRWQVLRNLLGNLMPLVFAGLIPVLPLKSTPNVGASYHVGVLRDQFGAPVIDSEGRAKASVNVLVADGAALPVLPPGPVTLSIMANAFRIANAASK